MSNFLRSMGIAVFVAAAIQSFTVGVLAPRLPREVLRPGVQDLRTLTLPKARLVQINNADGAVTVNVHERDVDAIEVTADIRAYTQTYTTKAVAEQYVKTLISVDATPDTITMVTEPEERPDVVDLRVDYSLKVPEGTNIRIVGTNGNVWIDKGCGEISVLGNNTDIEILGAHAPVTAKSTNGRIRVYDAAAPATLETVNGSIYANMLGGELKATTTNGHVYATLMDKDVKACDLTVMNGGITLVMPEGISARVDAATGHGTVRSEFVLQEQGGVQRPREVHGAIGDGHARLTLNSLNGDIWITRSTT